MMSGSKRFRVALSFPGEHRPFLEKVAARLATELGRDRVLYDSYHEAEFARPNLDTHLQGLYHDQSDLIAVFLCEDYERKEWCGLEWRAIRDLIKKREDETVMPFRFDTAEIPGVFSIDGYSWIGDRRPDQVADLILQRLGLRIADPPPPGSRRIEPTRLTHATDRLFGRETELAALDKAWTDPATHVVTLVAWGGVGKTSLVAKWVADLAARDHDGADYFDWSFYSQGSREEGGASADPFVDKALRFFGDAATADSAQSPWDKGSRLAQRVAQRRTLLVLDGLEPLQHPPGPLAGELKDPAMTALLKGLAARNPGLCVVTTRERVENLIAFEGSTAPKWELEHLSTPAGVELLTSVGVHGAAADLQTLVEDVAGHALTLNLLGRYLVKAHRGDVRRRDRVDLSKADRKKQAFHVMEAYETWLSTGGEDGQRQLAILRLLGLFDRPADPECVAALCKEPAIPGLTEPLVNLDEEDWNVAIDDLAVCGPGTPRPGTQPRRPPTRPRALRPSPPAAEPRRLERGPQPTLRSPERHH